MMERGGALFLLYVCSFKAFTAKRAKRTHKLSLYGKGTICGSHNLHVIMSLVFTQMRNWEMTPAMHHRKLKYIRISVNKFVRVLQHSFRSTLVVLASSNERFNGSFKSSINSASRFRSNLPQFIFTHNCDFLTLVSQWDDLILLAPSVSPSVIMQFNNCFNWLRTMICM